MKRDCSVSVLKTKALNRWAVTVQLICAFVFAYAKSRFSHDVAHLIKSIMALTQIIVQICNLLHFLAVKMTILRYLIIFCHIDFGLSISFSYV